MFFIITVISITSISYMLDWRGSDVSHSHCVNSGKYWRIILQNAAKSLSYNFLFLRCFSPCHDKFSPLRKTFYFIMHRLNLQCLSVIFVREIFAFQSCLPDNSRSRMWAIGAQAFLISSTVFVCAPSSISRERGRRCMLYR